MKKGLLIVLIGLLFLPYCVKAETDLAPQAKSAILLEASTGKVIFEKNSHEKLHPASMTKMMSMLLILENIEKGVLTWDQMITVSANASGMGGSQILLETGEQMSVDDLFKGIAVASGNDAVVALAEAIAGNVEGFVDMMNQRVEELGLKDTHFKNPHGLDDADHYSSAYDMAMIGKELVKHEKVLEYSSIYEDYLRKGTDKEIWLVNTNKLVRFYPGVDGLKTGFTSEAGYCLTATAKKNNMRLIATVMGEETSATRNAEVSALLDYGYAQYKITELLDLTVPLAKVEIEKGKQRYVEIVPKTNATLLTKKTEQIGKISYDLNMDSIKAPLKSGDEVGTLSILQDGKEINQVKVTIKEDLKKANFGELFYRYFTDITMGSMKFLR